jgi:hypothetical protein
MSVTRSSAPNGAMRPKVNGRLLSEGADIVALQRRDNAGHTVVSRYGTFKLS